METTAERDYEVYTVTGVADNPATGEQMSGGALCALLLAAVLVVCVALVERRKK